jgi:8-hydroxy-5-deazaflavin:NADPH oxidoreductase
MRIGILGTGVVGRTLAGKLAERGNDVVMGSRDPSALAGRTEPDRMGNESFAEWYGKHPAVRLATFAESAAHGQVVVNATAGAAALEALRSAGEDNLAGKVLLDISNPLDAAQGFPPPLFVSNTDSLAERIQRAFPRARVVKSLNTVTAAVMVDPSLVAGGDHAAFVSGDDDEAKEQVTSLLRDAFGWRHVIDLGDITSARGAEMYMALWLRLMGALETPMFNVSIVT